MTEAEKVKYAVWLSRVGLLHSGLIRQSCVASAKVTTEVLRSLHLPARPMTASVMAMTAGWLDRLERGERPSVETMDEWWEQDQGYSVGVAYDPTPQEGAWTAHAIVLSGTWLCDPSLDQLSRPQKGLPLTPAVVNMADAPQMNPHEFKRGRTQAIAGWKPDEGGREFFVVWSCFPSDRSFRELPDFVLCEERYGSLIRSIVSTIKEMDEDGLTGDTLPPLPEIPDAPDDPRLMAREQSPEVQARIRMTVE